MPQPQPWCAHQVRRKAETWTKLHICKASTSCRWFGVQKLEASANRHGFTYEVWCKGRPQVLLWELQVAWWLTKAEVTSIYVSGPCSTTAPHPSCAPTQASPTSSLISTGVEHKHTGKDWPNPTTNHASFKRFFPSSLKTQRFVLSEKPRERWCMGGEPRPPPWPTRTCSDTSPRWTI